jgi:hypothetical protein
VWKPLKEVSSPQRDLPTHLPLREHGLARRVAQERGDIAILAVPDAVVLFNEIPENELIDTLTGDTLMTDALETDVLTSIQQSLTVNRLQDPHRITARDFIPALLLRVKGFLLRRKERHLRKTGSLSIFLVLLTKSQRPPNQRKRNRQQDLNLQQRKMRARPQ